MMHGRGKSDPDVVAMKPANKAERSVAEPVERRKGTKGNARQQSTLRAQYRVKRALTLGRMRHTTIAGWRLDPR
jgi:RNA-directed DNA polymerase